MHTSTADHTALRSLFPACPPSMTSCPGRSDPIGGATQPTGSSQPMDAEEEYGDEWQREQFREQVVAMWQRSWRRGGEAFFYEGRFYIGVAATRPVFVPPPDFLVLPPQLWTQCACVRHCSVCVYDGRTHCVGCWDTTQPCACEPGCCGCADSDTESDTESINEGMLNEERPNGCAPQPADSLTSAGHPSAGAIKPSARQTAPPPMTARDFQPVLEIVGTWWHASHLINGCYALKDCESRCGCSCGCRQPCPPDELMECRGCGSIFHIRCCWGPWGDALCCGCMPPGSYPELV
jgi:hypothetical protein